MTDGSSQIWEFGPFRLDTRAYCLTKRAEGRDEAIALRPKAFEVLKYLVENAGRTVPQDEFLTKLWPATYVQPEVLKGHVLAVRTALGDREAPLRYIETVRGRGYRFVAEVATRWQGDIAGADDTIDFLVGREDARRELVTALDRARSGEAQIVFLSGEAGIGKTTLAETFAGAAKAQGTMVFIGHCLPGSSETDAYYPILEILTALSAGGLGETLKDALARFAPTWLVQLPRFEVPVGSNLQHDVIAATPHRMARELCDTLDALARTRPMLIVLEDVHWADEATLDLLQALASRKLRTKLMILATVRSSVASDADRSAGTLAHKLSMYRLAREITLKPLLLGDIETFLRSLAAAPPHALSAHLHVRSEGNPLFMRAMLDALVERDLVSMRGGGWQLSNGFEGLARRAPSSLVQLIEAEIDTLSSDEQRVLEAASISDGSFSPRMNHVASGLDEQAFEAVCEGLCRRAQLIRRNDIADLPAGRRVQAYAFRHALFRDVAYDRQGTLRQSQGHAAIADHMAETYAADLPAIAPSLAHHYEQAGSWPEAIHFLRVAARTTMQRFAHREAASLLQQAITLSQNLPASSRLLAELGALEELATIDLGVFNPRAAQTYEQLTELARDHGFVDVEARGLIGMGWALSWTDSDRSLEIMQLALSKSAMIHDPVQRARVRCSAHGWVSYIQGWSATDAAAVGTEMERLQNLDDLVAFNLSLVYQSLMHFSAARYDEAIAMIATGFSFLVAHGQKSHVDLGVPLWIYRLGSPWCRMSAGRLGEAIEEFSSGAAAYEANGDLGRSITLRIYHGFLYVWLHDHRAALDMLDATLAQVRASGAKLSPNDARVELIVRGLAELGLGNIGRALEHLTMADDEMRTRSTLSSWYWRLALSWGLTDAYLATDDLEAAAVCARRFLDQALATEERNWRGIAGEACARVALLQGDIVAARAYLTRAWADIDGYDVPFARWRLHSIEARVSDLLHDPVSAIRHRTSSGDVLEALAQTLPDGHPSRMTLLKPNQSYAPPLLRMIASRT